MNIRSVLLARAAMMLNVRSNFFIPDLIAALREKYQFVVNPTAPQEVLSTDATLNFKHGKIVTAETGKLIVIDSMAISRQVAVVDVATPTIHESTAEADYVLTDLVEWWNESAFKGAEELSPLGPRYYISQLECSLGTKLDAAFAKLRGVTGYLDETIAKYAKWNHGRPPATEFRINALSLLIDPTHVSLPCEFKLERRSGIPYEQGIYYSEAPLQTDDHIFALAELEKALAADQS